MSLLNEEDYKKALKYATKKHQGQKRIGGEDYISHPIAVAMMLKEKGFGYDYQIAGLFHDLLEDTDATEEEILALSNEEVLKAVKCVTKTKGYVMDTYVQGIKNNRMAKEVKACDRLHNLQSALETSEDFKRRYILESIDYYLDFSPEIPNAVKKLALSLKTPLKELSFLYEPIEDWKISN